MIFERILLRSFRNYTKLSLDLAPGLNLFLGSNAQGKTNFLESLYLLGTAKSFRVNREQELLNWDEDSASIKAEYVKDCGTKGELEIRWAKMPQSLERRILLNQSPLKRLSDFLGEVSSVLFVPQDLSLVQQGPNLRRRYLDILLCKISKSYFADLTKYQNVLKQRNSLLRKQTAGKAEFAFWDDLLADTALRITLKRQETVKKLNKSVSSFFKRISHDENKLSLTYRSTLGKEDKEAIIQTLQANRYEESTRGLTLIGPHRDDFDINLNGKSLKRTGSQGQHRMCALALRLGEGEIMGEELQEKAVILLDDCFSELDILRSGRLLDCLSTSGQVIVTSASSMAHLTDLNTLKENSQTLPWTSYSVINGNITKNLDKITIPTPEETNNENQL